MHVDACESGGLERTRQLGHQERVGGERKVADAVYRGDALNDLDQVHAQGRLAAGQPELAETNADRRAHDALDFQRGQQLRIG